MASKKLVIGGPLAEAAVSGFLAGMRAEAGIIACTPV